MWPKIDLIFRFAARGVRGEFERVGTPMTIIHIATLALMPSMAAVVATSALQAGVLTGQAL